MAENLPHFRPIAMLLKVFMSQLDLDKPFVGGLGSFKLYCLLARHLQQIPQVKNMEAGSLLLSFLKVHGDPEHWSRELKIVIDGPRSRLTADFSSVHMIDEIIDVFARAEAALRSEEPNSLGRIIQSNQLLYERQEAARNVRLCESGEWRRQANHWYTKPYGGSGKGGGRNGGKGGGKGSKMLNKHDGTSHFWSPKHGVLALADKGVKPKTKNAQPRQKQGKASQTANKEAKRGKNKQFKQDQKRPAKRRRKANTSTASQNFIRI